MRSAGWVCAFPRFYGYIELTPYIYMYIYIYIYIQYFVGAWLALRMPPPSVFSKPSGAESHVFETENVSELFIYIYIYTYIVVYLSKRIAHKSFCVLYIYIYLYISIYLYIYVCVCLCLDAGIIHIKLAGSNKSSGQAGFQHTGA